jgi:RNA polymerase sigma-70 factor (ECF subfamily)
MSLLMHETPGRSGSGEGAGSPGKPPPGGKPAQGSGPPAVDWSELVERIQRGDPRGMEQLYAVFSRGVRFYLCRQLGPEELEDRVHDTFLIVVQAVRRGELRDPNRLMGFVRTVVRRQVAAHIDRAVHLRKGRIELHAGLAISDQRSDPEQELMARQKVELMEKVLRSVSRRDREILTRFYLLEQTQEQICREMKLTETQFRLLKSRAKARFGELGKRRLQRRFPWLGARNSAQAAH